MIFFPSTGSIFLTIVNFICIHDSTFTQEINHSFFQEYMASLMFYMPVLLLRMLVRKTRTGVKLVIHFLRSNYCRSCAYNNFIIIEHYIQLQTIRKVGVFLFPKTCQRCPGKVKHFVLQSLVVCCIDLNFHSSHLNFIHPVFLSPSKQIETLIDMYVIRFQNNLVSASKVLYDTTAIYSRVIGIQVSSRKLDLKKVLRHELAPVSTSMFNDTGAAIF